MTQRWVPEINARNLSSSVAAKKSLPPKIFKFIRYPSEWGGLDTSIEPQFVVAGRSETPTP